jgi:hypothetical protein
LRLGQQASLRRAGNFPDDVHVIGGKVTCMGIDVRTVEHRPGHGDRPAQQLRRSNRQVGSLLGVDTADPQQCVAITSGQLSLVPAQVHSQLRCRMVSCVAGAHLVGVAIQP